MYPFDSLPENLAAFCGVLRRDLGFRIGSAEVRDAARALTLAPLGDERAVRQRLGAVLCGSLEDLRRFDAAFRAFFHPRTEATPGEKVGRSRRDRDGTLPGERARRAATRAEPDAELESSPGSPRPVAGMADVQEPESEATATGRALLPWSYSPLEAEGVPPVIGPVSRAWRDAARALVARLRLGRARRWRPAPRGPRFDMRRALRGSLHTGGELVVPRWRARPRRRPRFVVLVDGSRSMGAAATEVLKGAIAISSLTAGCETFVFSTRLHRVTGEVRRAAAGERVVLSELSSAWGGGTTIGACLQLFLRRHRERLLTRDTTVFIVSDGLDVGDISLLRESLQTIRRLTAGIVWFNPLLETPGYEPTAAGMLAARPFVGRLAAGVKPEDWSGSVRA